MRCRAVRVTGGTIAVLGLMIGACATAPPVQEMSDARQAIAIAASANAATLAPTLYTDAERLLAAAEAQIRAEAYGRARTSALRAKSRAQRALTRAEAAASE